MLHFVLKCAKHHDYAESQMALNLCNSPNDIISRSYDNKKVDEDENFSYKGIFPLFLESPKYSTYQKLYDGLVAL